MTASKACTHDLLSLKTTLFFFPPPSVMIKKQQIARRGKSPLPLPPIQKYSEREVNWGKLGLFR